MMNYMQQQSGPAMVANALRSLPAGGGPAVGGGGSFNPSASTPPPQYTAAQSPKGGAPADAAKAAGQWAGDNYFSPAATLGEGEMGPPVGTPQNDRGFGGMFDDLSSKVGGMSPGLDMLSKYADKLPLAGLFGGLFGK